MFYAAAEISPREIKAYRSFVSQAFPPALGDSTHEPFYSVDCIVRFKFPTVPAACGVNTLIRHGFLDKEPVDVPDPERELGVGTSFSKLNFAVFTERKGKGPDNEPRTKAKVPPPLLSPFVHGTAITGLAGTMQ
ncbi:hypothetical protein GGX14DRAFT_404203 [Mycena pura]|uniref:Uncharacterized protein n=1 Tax=Mycena pura TaxID=153505 RepID=A0AAD6UYL2_9AGAR|nr:hypothetical protein GGX14DRAFT_404203 [Mycena pura]